MNQGVHYVDLLGWIMGPVQEVTALCATQAHTIEVEDVALALLRFRSGAVGMLQATTAAYPGFPEPLEISGTGGSVVIEAGELRVAELADEKGDVGAYGGSPGPSAPAGATAAAGPAAATAAADPAAVADAAHRAQLADFLTALDGGGQPLVTGDQARANVAVIRAVYDSARSGRPVVPAPQRNRNGTASAVLYGVDVPAMLFQLHEWDIHIVCFGTDDASGAGSKAAVTDGPPRQPGTFRH